MRSRIFAIVLVVGLPQSAMAVPERRDVVEECEQVASRAACDPQTGYIAGPSGPCAPHDLACVRDAWQRVSDPTHYPSLGPLCGRSHEDGGVLVVCEGEPGRAAPGEAPPPPPPPPTPAEAQRTCPNPPAPTLRRNPDPEGLTGLETYLWAEPQGTMTSTGSIRGYPVGCTATPVSWRWDTGDGASHTQGSPGAEPPRHAASHTYERRDTYTQRLTVTWRLDTNYGSGTTTRATAVPYKVIEARSVLTG